MPHCRDHWMVAAKHLTASLVTRLRAAPDRSGDTGRLFLSKSKSRSRWAKAARRSFSGCGATFVRSSNWNGSIRLVPSKTVARRSCCPFSGRSASMPYWKTVQATAGPRWRASAQPERCASRYWPLHRPRLRRSPRCTPRAHRYSWSRARAKSRRRRRSVNPTRRSTRATTGSRFFLRARSHSPTSSGRTWDFAPPTMSSCQSAQEAACSDARSVSVS